MHRFQVYFRAFKSRNYRYFFLGQIISLTGFWLTRIATNWLVYRLTGSVLLLGVVNFAGQIPSAILLPFAGVLVDRCDKKKLFFIAQCLLIFPPLALAWLTLREEIVFWQILLLNVIFGIINGFDVPVRQALLVEMVEKKQDLSNAIALNSSMFNIARLVGPSLGGIVIAVFGEWVCFLLDALSYLPVLVTIAAMKIKNHPHPHSSEPLFVKLKEGFQYAFGFFPIRSLLIMVTVISAFGMSYVVLLPAIAREVLLGGAETLGFLTGATGIGALAGAFFLAGQRNVAAYGKYISFASILGGLGLILFSFSDVLIISLFFVVMSSFGFILQLASCNSVLQSVVDDDKRGRVMSHYSLALFGAAPLGTLLISKLAQDHGVFFAARFGGLICCLAGILFSLGLSKWFHHLKPIYIRKGILQEASAVGV